MPMVSSILPQSTATFGTDQLEAEKIMRRRKMAEAMQARSMEPMGGTEVVSGYAVRKSPLEGISKVAQAYAGMRGQEQADNDAKALGERQNSEMQRDLSKYEEIARGMPERSVSPLTPGDDEGNMNPDVTMPAVAGDRRAAIASLLGSNNPMLKQLALTQMMKTDELKAGKPGDVLYGPDGSIKATLPTAPKVAEPFTLSPGQVRYGVDSKPIVAAPDKPQAPDELTLALTNAGIDPKSPEAQALYKARAKKIATHQPANVVNVDARERQRTFENENKLRDDYKADPNVKAASEMNAAFQLIDTANKRPSPANDLALATKYMKILDPTSVVRESELGMALAATGLMDKVQSYAENIVTGKKLNPAQRKDFFDSAKAINDAMQGQLSNVQKNYSELATGYGLKPENVVPSLRTRRATDTPAAAPAAPLSAAEKAELAELRKKLGK